MLGTNILEKRHYQVKHIFNNARDTTPYEVLDFINTVIKWYFKTLIKRRDKITLAPILVPLPNYPLNGYRRFNAIK